MRARPLRDPLVATTLALSLQCCFPSFSLPQSFGASFSLEAQSVQAV